MVYRLDDFPQGIDMAQIQYIRRLFNHYKAVCTLVVLAERLEKLDPSVVKFVAKSPTFDIQLHGWAHENYPEVSDEKVHEDLYNSLKEMEKHFGSMPTVWYPPWNGWTKQDKFGGRPRLERIGKDYGLELGDIGVGIGQALKQDTDCVWFHSWQGKEMEQLPKLLEKYERHLSSQGV